MSYQGNNFERNLKNNFEMNEKRMKIFFCKNALSLDLDYIKEKFPQAEFKEYSCGGVIETKEILEALEKDFEKVLILVCSKGNCENKIGNLKAEKKIWEARKYLEEIDIPTNILTIEMIKDFKKDELEKILRD